MHTILGPPKWLTALPSSPDLCLPQTHRSTVQCTDEHTTKEHCPAFTSDHNILIPLELNETRIHDQDEKGTEPTRKEWMVPRGLCAFDQ